jgi:hypothetical protein
MEMSDTSPQEISACAVHMLARHEWFNDPGIVARTRIVVEAGRLARFLSHKRFSGKGVAAITLGHTIHFRKAEKYAPHTPGGLALLAHEIKHIEQYEQQNLPRFYIRYLWDQIRRGYNKVRFEQEAAALQEQVRAHLQAEFDANPGCSHCEQAGTHAPNHAFVQRPPQAFHFPN